MSVKQDLTVLGLWALFGLVSAGGLAVKIRELQSPPSPVTETAGNSLVQIKYIHASADPRTQTVTVVFSGEDQSGHHRRHKTTASKEELMTLSDHEILGKYEKTLPLTPDEHEWAVCELNRGRAWLVEQLRRTPENAEIVGGETRWNIPDDAWKMVLAGQKDKAEWAPYNDGNVWTYETAATATDSCVPVR